MQQYGDNGRMQFPQQNSMFPGQPNQGGPNPGPVNCSPQQPGQGSHDTMSPQQWCHQLPVIFNLNVHLLINIGCLLRHSCKYPVFRFDVVQLGFSSCFFSQHNFLTVHLKSSLMKNVNHVSLSELSLLVHKTSWQFFTKLLAEAQSFNTFWCCSYL